MSISFVAIALSSSDTASKPTGATENDLLLAGCFCGFSQSITPPSGWTLEIEEEDGPYEDALFLGMRYRLYRKRLGAGEPASYAFTGAMQVVIAAYRSSQVISILRSDTGKVEHAEGHILTIPSLIPTVAGQVSVIMAAMYDQTDTAVGSPGTWTERGDQFGEWAYDRTLGSEESGAFTITYTLDETSIGVHVILAETAAGFRAYCNNVNMEVA